MVEAGEPIGSVAQMPGHTNPSDINSAYARFLPDTLTVAAEFPNVGEVRQIRP